MALRRSWFGIGLPRRTDVLSPRRRRLGWLAAALGPVIMVGLVSAAGSGVGLPTVLLLLVALTVAVALLGGMGPAITTAVLGSGLINFFITPPRFTLAIANVDNAVALVVSVVIGVAVATVVDLAARRSLQAQAARADADVLATLAGSVLRGEDTLAGVCDQLRATFGLNAVALQEQVADGAGWEVVHRSGDPVGQDTEVAVTPTLRLVLSGPPLPASAQRLMEAFAGQAVAVLERERLRRRAAAARRLEEGEAVRTALLAAVGHDLRTPLASIKAATSSLQQTDVTWSETDRAALLATVGVATERLERLISNLLDLSRLQSGTARALLRPASLEEVVLPALEGIPTERLDLELDEALPLVITDAGLLERAVANVVQNAVAYSDRPVRVVAEAVDPDRITIMIIDHDPGVTAGDKERMFLPFQRLGDVPAGNGLGLGLAVARGMIEAVGASVRVDDTPGGGLTFMIEVPIAAYEVLVP